MVCDRHVARAEALVREKGTDEKGNLYELVVWRVPVTSRHPQGVRYRLAFIRVGEDVPAVLYDNHHPKGHHRHFRGKEETYGLTNVDRLLEDFLADVADVKRALD
jgi:Family of unknown function (DUF6516)